MENRRQFLLAAAAAMAGGAAAPAFAKLADGVSGPATAKETHEYPFGVHKIFVQGPTDMLRFMESGSLALEPGMEPHPPHRHPEEEFLLVAEGEGEISVEGEITKVGPGSLMYTGGDRLHGILNTGAKPLLFYYFKWAK